MSTATVPTVEPAVPKLKVFLSYSRKDTLFAKRLVAPLRAREFSAFLDEDDIAPGEPWRERLTRLIDSADTVVFVMSPDSIESKVCGWEVDEAERLSKRILPVVWRSVADEKVPGRLRRLNWVFLTEAHDFAEGLDKLVAALLTDLVWIREHTRLGEEARLWIDQSMPDDLLLRGKALAAAELWISSRPREAPEPTPDHRTFIQASREAEQAREAQRQQQLALIETEQRQRSRFQKRSAWALTAVGVLVVAGLIVGVFQARETTTREARVFTSLAAKAFREQRYDRAQRFALQALPPPGATPLWQWSSEAEAKLAGSALLSRLLRVIHGHAGPCAGGGV